MDKLSLQRKKTASVDTKNSAKTAQNSPLDILSNSNWIIKDASSGMKYCCEQLDVEGGALIVLTRNNKYAGRFNTSDDAGYAVKYLARAHPEFAWVAMPFFVEVAA